MYLVNLGKTPHDPSEAPPKPTIPWGHATSPPKIPQKNAGRPATPQMYDPGRTNTKKGETFGDKRRKGLRQTRKRKWF